MRNRLEEEESWIKGREIWGKRRRRVELKEEESWVGGRGEWVQRKRKRFVG